MGGSRVQPFYGPAIDAALASSAQDLTVLIVEVSRALDEAEHRHVAEERRIAQVKRQLGRLRAAVSALYF